MFELPPFEAFRQIVLTRRTIGAFAPDPIAPETVAEALELACWAPNHHKTEPWRFTHLGPQTQLEVIALNTELISAKKGPEAAESKRRQWSQIPGWLAVSCLRSDDALRHEEDYAACCCAIQNLMLAFWCRGVGTKWSTGDVTRHDRFYQLLQIDPAAERIVGLIWYGMPQTIPIQSRTPASGVTRELP